MARLSAVLAVFLMVLLVVEGVFGAGESRKKGADTM